MNNLHRLLLRQVRNHFGSWEGVPAGLQNFIDEVNTAYHQFDDDREMVERSLDLSSQELTQANSEMQAVFQAFPDILFRIDKEGKILDFKGGWPDDILIPHSHTARKGNRSLRA
jgi:PAS domain-containing protein